MRILIEEHQYEVSVIKDILHDIDALENAEGRVSVHYVGYYYNTLLKDCVFILPKVLLQDVVDENGVKNEKVFGKYKPENILNLNKENPLEPQEKDFLYKFAVWIYRAIVVYRNDGRCDSDIVYYMKINQVDKGRRRQSNTYLDILLSLVKWAKDNKQFVFFVLKNQHSGFNKINWTRTIGTTTAIVKHGKPAYLNPVNKKKQVNFDEELLIIFYSILNYISNTYGFPKDINCQFELITGNKFESYLNGYGKMRLHQIKYKYFSDKALELWKLCYAFFDESRSVFVGSEQKEYLLVKNFYIVFEAIIDELIGDNPLPDGMDKKQEDGKIVDHMFTADSLIENQEEKKTPTYYIGDSKYYKIGHELGAESIYKQYTYARNVIQWNLDLFYDDEKPNPMVRLRDDVTEGYNIIPNFFISGKMEKDGEHRFDYTFDGIGATDSRKQQHIKTQFPNRLFDRDTMLLFHYDVNFLFVLSLYARDNESQKATWKGKMRDKFRDDTREWLQKSYDFYAMKARPGVDGETYIKQNFKKVLGKVYTPFQEEDVFSLALDNTDPEHDNDAIKAELELFFFVKPCPLGTDPKRVLPQTFGEIKVEPKDNDLVLCFCREGDHFDRAIERIKNNGQVGIALQPTGATLQLVEGFTKAKYLLVHNKAKKQMLFYFDGKGPRFVNGADCKDMAVTKQGAQLYLVYNIDLKVRPYIGELDMTAITSLGDESYSPQLLPIKGLIR